MKKVHYHGGGSLGGFGSVVKAKGRSGGIGVSGAALREQRREAAKVEKRELAAKIRANEKAIRQLAKEWATEKGRKQYEGLVEAKRPESSPLAAALHKALRDDS